MIPLMRDVIRKFKACDPACHWAGDMDVQTGYELCTHPGWLMLLLFSIRNEKNAVSSTQAIQACHQLLKTSLRLTEDHGVLDSPMLAVSHFVKPTGDLEQIKKQRDYVSQRAAQLHASLAHIGLDNKIIPDMYVAKAVDAFLAVAEYRDDVTMCAKAAHTSIDMVSLALLTEKYPGFFADTLNISNPTPVADIKIFHLAKRVELCNLLRKHVPQPFLSYE